MKFFSFEFLQEEEQTQDREESSDDSNDKKPVEKFELVTVLVSKAGFQRYHLSKRSLMTIGKEKFAHSYCCRGNYQCPEISRKTFYTKMP